MSLTRAEFDAVIIRRCGKLLEAARLDGTTLGGLNADLHDPAGYAIRRAGGMVANTLLPADGDFAAIDAGLTNAILDLGELRALETALGNLDRVTLKAGDVQQNLTDLGTRLELIAQKRSRVEREYGTGLSSLEAGVLALGFQEDNNMGYP